MARQLCRESGKTAYKDKYAAVRAMKSMVRDDSYKREKGSYLGVYKCPACHCWHIGNNIKEEARKRRRE